MHLHFLAFLAQSFKGHAVPDAHRGLQRRWQARPGRPHLRRGDQSRRVRSDARRKNQQRQFHFGTDVSSSINAKVPKTISAGQSTIIHPAITLTEGGSRSVIGNSTVQVFLSDGTNLMALSTPTIQPLHIKAHKAPQDPLGALAIPSSLSVGTYRVVAKITDAVGGISFTVSPKTIIIVT